MNGPDSVDRDALEGGVGKRTGVGTGELDLDFESLRCRCGTEDKDCCFFDSDMDRPVEGDGGGRMGLGEVRMARLLTLALARCEGIGRSPFAILFRGSSSRPRLIFTSKN